MRYVRVDLIVRADLIVYKERQRSQHDSKREIRQDLTQRLFGRTTTLTFL